MTRTQFDLNDPAVITDPYPHYAWLRDEAPVYRSSDPDLWILSRRDDVAVAVRDATLFSSDLGKAARFDDNPFNPTIKIPRRLAGLLGRIVPLRTLLTSDPPDHTQLRHKVSRAFTPRRINAWEPGFGKSPSAWSTTSPRNPRAGRSIWWQTWHPRYRQSSLPR